MGHEPTDDDEDSLFRDRMADVTPLKDHNRVSHKPVSKPINIRQTESDSTAIRDVFSDEMAGEDCPDTLSYSSAGLQHRVIKQLRTGKFPVEHVLDLHGFTVDQARNALIGFLDECRQAELKSVLIIHGKGFRSKNKPVIKSMVNRWLQATDQVLAFHSALPKDGGSGAVYVLLRKG